MDTQDVYISQREKSTELYVGLQSETIAKIQGFSGKVWTDYNAHDPGITIVEVLNYALTELNYKWHFPLEDYLTGNGKSFQPEDFGFFLPDKVFPVSPVTPDDYRKFFLMRVPELENIWIDVDPATGKYAFHLELFRFVERVICEEIEGRVRELFQSSRNLGESLGSIDFVKLEEMRLLAEINILPGVDATAVLVEVLQQAYSYLARHVGFRLPAEREEEGISPAEWLDGPNDTEIQLSTVGEDVVGTETELYHLLCRVRGVKSIHSCFIRDSSGEVRNQFLKPYSLYIPQSLYELNSMLNVRVDGRPAVLRFERLLAELNSAKLTSGNYWKVRQGKTFKVEYPSGMYKPVYEHESVMTDFPECYGIGEKGVGPGVSEERRAQIRQLKSYLYLPDCVFLRGLTELRELPRLMSLKAEHEIDVLPAEQQLKDNSFFVRTDEEAWRSFCVRDVTPVKLRLLDMYDALYGEDSNPGWLNEYNYYDDTDADRVDQRVNFLRQVPLWGKNRFLGCDWSGGQNATNVPGIKAYVSALLNWQCDEGKAVGNIFPSYNLNFITEEEYELQLSRMLRSDLIDEQMLNGHNMKPIERSPEVYTATDYEEMRMRLSYFMNNLLNEALFRNGIHVDNFRLVNLGGSEWLLAFRNQERKVWMALGRMVDKQKLNRLANVLRQFLLHLNRQSEVMYVVEHQYFKPEEPMVLSVVLSNWSARMSVPRFQKICEEFIESRLPAHLKARFCWVGLDGMQRFEALWRRWRELMQAGIQEDADIVMKDIQQLLHPDKTV